MMHMCSLRSVPRLKARIDGSAGVAIPEWIIPYDTGRITGEAKKTVNLD